MSTNRQLKRILQGSGAVVVVAMIAALSWAVIGAGADEVDLDNVANGPAGPTSTSTSEVPGTTTSVTSSTTTPPPTVPPGPTEHLLVQGSSGPEVKALQERLVSLQLDPGPADGKFGLATTYAVQAFEKLNGLSPRGKVGDVERTALEAPAPLTSLVPNGGDDRVEVDLKRQLLVVYKGGAVRLITHVSTGNNQKFCDRGNCSKKAVTPIGSFRFSWRANGWWQAPLGKLYNPVYFTSDGVAVHGSLSVPTYPASHGCVRIPMHIAEYFPSLVQRGDAIYVTDGRPVGPPPPTAPAAPPPDTRPTTPGDDPPDSSSTTTTTASPTTTSTSTTTTTTTTTPTTTPPVTVP